MSAQPGTRFIIHLKGAAACSRPDESEGAAAIELSREINPK